VRVTHRFHPLSGRSFEFVNRRKSWQSDRVYFFGDAGELACLPAEWTDMVPGDPFVAVSAGRSPFRTADLLELAELIGELRQGAGSVPDDVKGLRRECPQDSAAVPACRLLDLSGNPVSDRRCAGIPGCPAAWRGGSC
jgi:hypothetical protein